MSLVWVRESWYDELEPSAYSGMGGVVPKSLVSLAMKCFGSHADQSAAILKNAKISRKLQSTTKRFMKINRKVRQPILNVVSGMILSCTVCFIPTYSLHVYSRQRSYIHVTIVSRWMT